MLYDGRVTLPQLLFLRASLDREDCAKTAFCSPRS